MSRKRTRSSKITLENPILIDQEVIERFDSIFKHQTMMLEKGFNLKSHDLIVIPAPIRKKINALKAHFKTQANLKGQYVQGCITNHDLERLVEKVHELNQREQEEPTKPDTEETETEANLVIDTEEEESDKEPNSPKPAEGSANPEPKVEPEEETVKLSVEPKFKTLMLTSTRTSKKSKLSIMMDMCKFMHNQQQTYWEYAKIRNDSI
ncbi:hypothetical protein J1N35_033985 [Gossypium stocksii]|uniref:Uncharacterized protein n=1 Tax=Gossypium stocksii TaxID=47602 RepID=A0A9D3UR67_9ROSI|nr:hypothetical protein J1N35_033985 [Gossypium stocksii]